MNRNNLAKEKIVISKFDDAKKEWEELNTQHIESDALYEYYDTVLTSFSYFVIAEKEVISAPEPIKQEEVSAPEIEEKEGLSPIIIITSVVAILIIIALILIPVLRKRTG